MSSILQLHEDDEEGFVLYEEYIVFEIQKNLREKVGLENKPVLELSAKLEDLLYQNTLRDHTVAVTTNLWGKKEYLTHYQNLSAKFLFNLQSKQLNWKKLFEEHEKNPEHIYQQIFKDDNKKGPKAPKSKPLTDDAEPAPPKVPKATKVKEEKKTTTKPPKAPKAPASNKKVIPQPILSMEESQAQVAELFNEHSHYHSSSHANATHSTAHMSVSMLPDDDLALFNTDPSADAMQMDDDFDFGFDLSENAGLEVTDINMAAWK
jgi:hypothetical protein